MRKFPEPISNLVAAFSRLPGVGPKTALRYVYYLLKQPTSDLDVMARALVALGEKVKVCGSCFMYAESESCEICRDPRREANILCVVEESRDIATIEATDAYHGRYHVLGGVLSPIEGVTPSVLRIRELEERIESHPEIEEIILACSPTVQGESTMLFLKNQLERHQRKITRLARGLPIGATIEFADEVTLEGAFKGRR